MSSTSVPNQLAVALVDRYVLERELGRGGMATVYLARDVKHNRPVALKVLDPELGAVLGAERFLSEIRVTANLQHPNLLPLFDSGEAEGLLYYVMPYIDGETLRHRLEREKQLPVDEAVRIATAIADALDYAHGHDVIHRDLKPENILLQHGQPIVADFGIALAVTKAGGARVTATGLSLGTPQYMSPEQATGDRVIDGRTDIYSLGAMTYEMLAGEPPHVGTTAQAIIARLMTETPRPLSATRHTVPEHVEAAIERALEKLPADRFASAREFRDALQGRAAVSTRAAVRATRTSPTRRTLPWIAAAALGVAAGAAGYFARGVPNATARPVRFTIDPPAGMSIYDQGTERPFALSPDGRTVVFAAGSNGALYLRRLDQLEPVPVANVERPVDLRFSPDGNWVAYKSNVSLMKVPVGGSASGSAPALIADSASGAGIGWTYGSDLVVARGGTFYRVPAAGGTLRKIADIDTSVDAFWTNPSILNDAKTIAFRRVPRGGRYGTSADRVALLSMDGGSRAVLDIEGQNALGYLDGHLVYGSIDGRIMAVPLDLKSRTLAGEPVALLEKVYTKVSAGVAAALGADGTLAYMTGSTNSVVDIFDLRGARLATLPVEPRSYRSVNWSPDGRKLLLEGSRLQGGGFGDLWVFDTDSRVTMRLTQDGDAVGARWTPDGKRIAFLRFPRGGVSAHWMPADGSGAAEPIPAATGLSTGFTISPDGRYLVAGTPLRPARGNVPAVTTPATAIPLDGSPRLPLLAGVQGPSAPVVSPDGRWMAYASREGGRREVYVRPFPAGPGRVQVSSNGGQNVSWLRDGRLAYQAGGALRAATLELGATPRVVRTDSLFALPDQADYSIHPDGKRVAVLRDEGAGPRLVVVTNWWSEARTKLPVR